MSDTNRLTNGDDGQIPSLAPPGTLPGAPGADTPPQTMEELCTQAQLLWKYKQKDKAFSYVIAGLRLISKGVGQTMNDITTIKEHPALKEPNEPNKKEGEEL